ncbi:hypothetical protein L249_8238 [Ophiocordyceps polyrhachis-furcata BCC 54312]|uniref:Uncharacterized protein n=1 Tax=Ophiocordyceps polyrhachis-furcata BCC 54312 TaxID=1330021 RepID=A0A367LHH6_9HYPO|nr:hypothetical protein L249_8238 [Ophiocordyceps polyrhachis-furcata BCC 54312]
MGHIQIIGDVTSSNWSVPRYFVPHLTKSVSYSKKSHPYLTLSTSKHWQADPTRHKKKMADESATVLIPETTLQRLAPSQPGTWYLTDQDSNCFTITYVMGADQAPVTYRVVPCNTEKDIADKCGRHVYKYTGYIPENVSQPAGSNHVAPLNIAITRRDDDGNVIPNQPQQPDDYVVSVNASMQNQLNAAAFQYVPPQADGLGQQPALPGDQSGLWIWNMASSQPFDGMTADNALGVLLGDHANGQNSFNDIIPSSGDMTLENADIGQMQWNDFNPIN